jgi:uncharacterized protein YfaP (DUF2135 family)
MSKWLNGPILGLLLAGCAAPADLEPPPSLPARAAEPGLRLELLWSAPVDLDLYVTDPTWETVYFGNTPSRSGGRLEQDQRCGGSAATRTEIVRFAEPRAGPYRIGVDFIDACDSRAEKATFRVAATLNGVTREATGTANLNVFQPIVLELELVSRADGSMAFSK